MNDEISAANSRKHRTLRDAYHERLLARQAEEAGSTGENAENQVLQNESLAREKVAFIERQRVKVAEAARAKELSAHWERTFEQFDKMEKSHERQVPRSADAVELLRKNLAERLKAALEIAPREMCYQQEHSR